MDQIERAVPAESTSNRCASFARDCLLFRRSFEVIGVISGASPFVLIVFLAPSFDAYFKRGKNKSRLSDPLGLFVLIVLHAPFPDAYFRRGKTEAGGRRIVRWSSLAADITIVTSTCPTWSKQAWPPGVTDCQPNHGREMTKASERCAALMKIRA